MTMIVDTPGINARLSTASIMHMYLPLVLRR